MKKFIWVGVEREYVMSDTDFRVTYVNGVAATKNEFAAEFETIRGANMFISTLEERDIEYSVSNF